MLAPKSLEWRMKQAKTVAARLAALPSMPMKELWVLWDAHFPRRPSSPNRPYLESRLAYRIQEIHLGGVPSQLRRMMVSAGAEHSKIKSHYSSKPGQSRITQLLPGTTLTREYGGREYRVTVNAAGLYELGGRVFRSLSAAARAITGTHWSGPIFFGVHKQVRRR